MKTRAKHWLALMQFRAGWYRLTLLVLPVAFFWLSSFTLGTPQSSLGALIFGFMNSLLWMGAYFYHFSFETGVFAKAFSASGEYGTLHFLFSRAISRRVIFTVKAGSWLLYLLLPWLGYLIRAWLHPDLQLTRYGKQDATADFYLTHFSGVLAVKNPNNPYEYTMTIPHGAFLAVVTGFFVYFFGILLYQLCMEITRKREVQIGVSIGLFVVILLFPFLGLWWKPLGSPSLTERAAGWIWPHLPLASCGLLILVLMVEGFCCRRFIHREIL